jgi:hypothetical protein
LPITLFTSILVLRTYSNWKRKNFCAWAEALKILHYVVGTIYIFKGTVEKESNPIGLSLFISTGLSQTRRTMKFLAHFPVVDRKKRLKRRIHSHNNSVLRIRIRAPECGIRCLFDPWIRDPGSGIGIFPDPDHKPIFLRA